MTQRSILITGCSSGIGRHCALRLHAEGWQVFATARKTEDLEALRAEGVTAIYMDYTEPQSIKACVEAVLNHTGGTLDALFNNGAYGQAGAVEDLPTDILRAQFEANLFGWHDLTCHIIPVMRKQGYGRIIHCSSVLALTGLAFRGAYVASKYALEGLTDTMRLEMHGSNIFISMIEPGPITSQFRENARLNFIKTIDTENSVYRDRYKIRLKAMESDAPGQFELPPEAVYKKLDRALNSANPKPRYMVTVPTYIMNAMRRFLPTRALDAFLRSYGD
ncbi:SDR family oxidoreductase [Cohaesibacter haloalkalitolerans]|uniref:SDR family oxidoreductase n=1 Tax=Cohaesibacter haloalkalitolerans TaxID=1162980 RepID=UPI000E651D5C|nr:SDR family oxidoreductase [Cohaesibacter haloalkalitolerans]